MKKDNFAKDYALIVKNIPQKFNTPEEQGAAIKRCSILKDVDIEYKTTRIGGNGRNKVDNSFDFK